MPVDKVCQQCGKDFQTPNRRSELVKYCSIPCRSAAHREIHKCECCGEEFSRKKSDNPDSAKKYCSKACDLASRKGRKHAVDPDAAQHFRDCEYCKTSFKVTAQRKDTARFCSIKCKSESPEFRKERSEIQMGEKSWRWGGGKYHTHEGYVTKRVDDGSRPLEHRHVLFNEMMRIDPNHPFIIEVNGVKKLNPEIEVHHIDRDRSNNTMPNLLAVTKYAHSQIHHRNRKPNPWECWPSNPESW